MDQGQERGWWYAKDGAMKTKIITRLKGYGLD